MGSTRLSGLSGIGSLTTQKLSRRNRVMLASVLALPALAPVAQAANQYWDINGTTTGASDVATADGVWDTTSTNWTTNSNGTAATGVWVSGNTAIFSAGTNATGASNITLGSPQTAAGVTIEEGTISFSGQDLTLTAPTITTTTAATMSNVITGSVGLTKAGGSTLTLTANNTYTGPTTMTSGTLTITGSNALAGTTTVSGGTLIAIADNAFGAVPGSPTDNVFNNATIRGNATFTLDANRTVVIGPTAGTGSGTGTFDVTTGNTFTIAGTVKANGTSTAALTKTGAGTLVLSGNVTHSNGVNVNAGSMLISGNASYGGTTTVNGANLTLTGTNTLTGATTVGNGTLTLDYTTNNNDKINAAGLLTINHLGVVTLAGSNAGSTSQTVNGLTTGTSGVATLNVNQGSGQNITANLGAVTRGTASVLNITAAAGSGTTTITTSNAGTNGILGGYATYNGDTWAAVSGGSVTGLAAYDADDFTAATKNTDVTTDQSPASGSSVNSIRFSAPANVTLSGANTITTGGILVASTGGGSLSGGTLSSGTADVVVHQNSASDFTLGSALTGTIGLTKAGSGALVLTGANTNTGTYTVAAGTLKLGASDVITNNAPVVVSTGATFDVNNFSDTVGNLSGFGTIALNGTLTTGGNTTAATFSGPLTGGGTLNKTGTGTQTLSGNSSGFSGPINVNQGVLVASAANALGTGGSTTVASGAALQVTGAVTIPEAITISGTGISNTGAIRKTANNATVLSGVTTLAAAARINSDSTTLTLSGTFDNAGFDLTIGGAGNTTVNSSGKIVGSGRLIKDGTGTLTLSGNSTYTGETVIKQGIVSIGNITTTGLGSNSSTVTLDGGTLQQTNTGVGGSFLSTSHTFQITANGGTIDVPSALPSIQTTPLTLAPGTASGLATTVLTKSGAGDFGTPATHMDMTKLNVVAGYYRLRSGATEAAFGLVPAAPLADAITLNGGGIGTALNLALDVNRGITIGANGGLFSISPSTTMTIPGTISGSGKMTFSNTGTTILSSPNNATSFTGALQVDSSTVSLDESLVVTSLSGAGGTINIASTKSLTAGGNGTSTSYAGVVGGSGAFNKVGSGTLTLNPASAEWTNTGGVNINAGTIKFGTSAAGFATGSTVTIAAGATLDMNNVNDTQGALAGAGAVVNMANLTVGGNNASTTFSGSFSGTGTLTKAGTGTMTLAAPVTLAGLTVSGGTLKLDTNAGTTKIGALAATAKLDVTNNRLVLTGTSATTLRGLLLSGRHDNGSGVGLWDGDGVNSSLAAGEANKATAIGYLTAADKGLTGGSWGGVAGLAATDVITKYTYYGDINLDGTVNGDDYALMDRGFARYSAGTIAAGTAVWLNGDVNYDGAVTAADFLLADTAFAHLSGVLSPGFLAGREAQFGSEYVSQLVAAVPEPTSLGLVAVGAVGLLGGRRRRGR